MEFRYTAQVRKPGEAACKVRTLSLQNVPGTKLDLAPQKPLTFDGSLQIRVVEPAKSEFDRILRIIGGIGCPPGEGGGGPEPSPPLFCEDEAGMGPSPSVCDGLKERLRAYSDAVSRWRVLLQKLSQAALRREPECFQAVWNEATQAQRECIAAREALAGHLAAERYGAEPDCRTPDAPSGTA